MTDQPAADRGLPSPERRDRLFSRRAGHAIVVALTFLTLVALLGLLGVPPHLLALLQLAVIAGLVAALLVRRQADTRMIDRREAREAGIMRMLQGMSRSVSSEAIVQAIVDELRGAADADHVIVARLRPADRVVETTLVSSRARVPPSRSTLPSSTLDPARVPVRRGRRSSKATGAPEQLVADDLARRLSQTYALSNTLAVPLVADDRILGALILSRRQQREWTPVDRRLLDWSAQELSAALSRAYAFEEAEVRANIDALTGLPNRRYLEEMLSTVGPRRRAAERIGALMIDLDHFKQLNDRYGHTTGDRVLRAVGERISAAVRADDTPARYGGEEFAVVLRRADPQQAVEVAERIRRHIGAIPPGDLGIDEPISVSIGVAVAEGRDVDAKSVLTAADDALYTAKREGRNRVVLAA
jgi:diguanylate cyclase (GGDEF)-like protein